MRKEKDGKKRSIKNKRNKWQIKEIKKENRN